MDCSPPGSPVPGILQARTLEWVAISFSNAWKWKVKVKLLSRVQLSNPMDCSLPGSSVHGVFQARVLEWGAIAFSRLEIWCSSKMKSTVMESCLYVEFVCMTQYIKFSEKLGRRIWWLISGNDLYLLSCAQSLSHVRLCNCIHSSPPGSSVQGIS